MAEDATIATLARLLTLVAKAPSADLETEIAALIGTIAPADRANTWLAVSQRCVVDRQWPATVTAIARSGVTDPAARLTLTLSKNLVALQTQRPAAYEAVVNAPPDNRFQIAAGPAGLPTVLYTPESGPVQRLSHDADPRKSMQMVCDSVGDAIATGESLALCGLGDGYLLAWLAANPPALFMSMQQTIHIIEPRPAAALVAMMIHDFTGESGPICQDRFRWYVGEDWQQQFEAAIPGDGLTPAPSHALRLGVDGAVVSDAIIKRVEYISAADLEEQRVIDLHYASVGQSDWAQLFGSFPNRPPRVLLLTTRFSTVLQYSTRDAADAFGQLGWETRTIIEPTDWQRAGKAYVRRQMLDFKPDFIFQIDHLRHEHGELFPPQLPFACWIQDHLQNLTQAAAGRAVGRRDFVLTGMGSLFVQQHEYPRRQIVDVPQLARVPIRPTEWRNDGPDLIYVSNCSTPADVAVDSLVKSIDSTVGQALVRAAIDSIRATYASGQTVQTYYDVREHLAAAADKVGVQIASDESKDRLVNAIFDRVNNVLFRHQALEWAASLAREGGLTLGLYGRGWESHPTLKEFARGPVQPGEAMERLTRQAKVNLQVEPYACFSHARLLNGLFAGGFFLIRDHPFNHLTRRLLDFVDRHFDASVTSVLQARSCAPSLQRDRFESLLRECRCLGEQVDPIGLVRDWQRSGVLVANDVTLPRMSDVLFDSPATLASAIDKFIDNPAFRAEVSDEQRRSMQGRLSYRAGLDRAMRAIGRLICTEVSTAKAA